MEIKTKKFVKNLAITAVGSVLGGMAGAELASLVTNSEAVISAGSLLTQLAVCYGVFVPLHEQDNRDLYRNDKDNIKWRVLFKDMAKFTGGVLALDVAYYLARPTATYVLQKKGFEPSTASFLADSICIPAYVALTIPIAKGLGLMRKK